MRNLEIQFNKEIIKKVKSLHFQVDQLGSILLVLFALYEDRIDLLDEFDDFNKQKRAFLLYKELEMRGLIISTNDGEGNPIYKLTEAGEELVEFIKTEFHKINENVTSADIAISGVEALKEEVAKEEVEQWIDGWLDIFPRGVKSGGRLLRSDKPSCIRKMKLFLREYGYDKNIIIEATKAYINFKAQTNFEYTRCAVYFIYRIEGVGVGKISDLASWCDQIIHDKNKPISEDNLDILA